MFKLQNVKKNFCTPVVSAAGVNKVRCRECAITPTITTGSTSVMRNHLAFKHLQLYEKMIEDETSVKKSKAELVNISVM